MVLEEDVLKTVLESDDRLVQKMVVVVARNKVPKYYLHNLYSTESAGTILLEEWQTVVHQDVLCSASNES